MHPQIIKDAPDYCPICGMDLVPMQQVEDDENKTYNALMKKFKISVMFPIPVFFIAISAMLSLNTFFHILRQDKLIV
mgnify:CR=1 FL=1